MKPIENTTGSEVSLPKLMGAAAGALTSTLAAKLLGRPRAALKRKARSWRKAPAKKGGARRG